MKIFYRMNIRNNICISDYNNQSKDPVEVAKYLESLGAYGLQVVDLDGAFDGDYTQYDMLERIIAAVSIPVRTGGGIRSYDVAEKLINMNVDKIIIGTAAVKKQEVLLKLLENYTDKIIVSVDAYNSMVFIDGWEESSDIELLGLLNTLQLIGTEEILYSDISRNDTAQGPNYKELDTILGATHMEIYASGNIHTIEETVKLKEMGINEIVIENILK